MNNCLFCGKTPDLYNSGPEWLIECDCGINTGWYSSKEQVLEFWNKPKLVVNLLEASTRYMDKMWYDSEDNAQIEVFVDLSKAIEAMK